MRVRLLQPIGDLATGETHKPGDELELEQGAALVAAGVAEAVKAGKPAATGSRKRSSTGKRTAARSSHKG